MLGYAYTHCEFAHCIYGGLSCFIRSHALFIDAHGFGDFAIFLNGGRHVEFHHYRQQQSVGYSVGYVEDSSERVSHAVHGAETYVGECHAGDILGHCHAVAGFGVRRFVDSCRKIAVDHVDSLDLEHVAHFPSALGDEAFYGVGQRVHAGGCRQAAGKGVHQFGIDDSYGGYVVGIHAHHLLLVLFVGDHVVYGDFGGCAGGGRECDHRH